jgi:hypothetical protein
MGISNSLVDLGMLHIHDIPQLPKLAREALMVAGLILECLQEAQTSSASPWDRAWADHHGPGFGLSASSFFHSLFLLPLRMIVIYILIYIYIFIYLFTWMLENLCRYTPERTCPQPQ